MQRDSPEVLDYLRSEIAKGTNRAEIARLCDEQYGTDFKTRDALKNYAKRHHLNEPASETKPDLQTRINREKTIIIERAEKRDFSRQLRERADLDILCDAMTTAIHDLPPLDPAGKPAPRDGPYEDEHAVLLLSDAHIGYRFTREEAVGLWEYDYSVFKRYVWNLASKLRQIIPRHNYKIPVLHLHFLGDISDGALTWEGQLRQLDLSMMKQALAALDNFTWFIRECLTLFDTVECDGVPGNHPRVGKKGVLDPADNFDTVAYWFLKLRFENEKRVKWNVASTPFVLTNICGWTQALMHGDRIPRHLGIPWYAIQRHNQNLVTLVDDLSGVHVDTVEMGHHHEPAWLPQGVWGDCYINGCFTGATDLSIHGMRKAIQPTQFLYGISPDRPVTWHYKLSLHDRTPPKAVCHV
jgi:hypothetical protein